MRKPPSRCGRRRSLATGSHTLGARKCEARPDARRFGWNGSCIRSCPMQQGDNLLAWPPAKAYPGTHTRHAYADLRGSERQQAMPTYRRSFAAHLRACWLAVVLCAATLCVLTPVAVADTAGLIQQQISHSQNHLSELQSKIATSSSQIGRLGRGIVSGAGSSRSRQGSTQEVRSCSSRAGRRRERGST